MILLSGATGRTGRHVLERARADDQPVRALVRDPEKAAALTATGVDTVVGDLGDPDVLRAAMNGVERALLLAANSPAQLDQELAFIAAAENAGVKQVAKMSAIGADADSEAVLKRFHGTAEARLRDTIPDHAIVQPNFFMQNLLNVAPAIAKDARFALPMGRGRVAPIDIRDVADALYAALTRPAAAGRTWLISGPELLSFADMAAILSEVLGREVAYHDLPPDRFRDHMVSLGVPPWNVDAMGQLFGKIREDRNAIVTDEFESLTGRRPRTFREFVEDHADAFRGG